MSKHSHSYSGATTYNQGHIHHYGGVTDKAESGVPHNHCMQGITTFNDGHEHSYETKTGPAITLACGCHYHCFETKVTFVDGHIHYISGYTSVD
ncbi:MAG: YmaF family protein [Clostridiaceae bacterium]